MKFKLFILVLVVTSFMLVNSCGKKKEDNKKLGKVLVVLVEKEIKDSFGILAFDKALDIGGQVSITIDEVKDSNYDFTDYTVTNQEGSYYTNGALLNFITSKNWNYHSNNLKSYTFTR